MREPRSSLYSTYELPPGAATQAKGIIPRIIDDLFTAMDTSSDDTEFTISVS